MNVKLRFVAASDNLYFGPFARREIHVRLVFLGLLFRQSLHGNSGKEMYCAE